MQIHLELLLKLQTTFEVDIDPNYKMKIAFTYITLKRYGNDVVSLKLFHEIIRKSALQPEWRPLGSCD